MGFTRRKCLFVHSSDFRKVPEICNQYASKSASFWIVKSSRDSMQNKPTLPIKAIGYCRVSTEEQAREGVSLSNQQEKIRAYASLRDMELVEIITDAGLSAKNMNRAGLQKALEMLASGAANALIVYKLDRLTRSTKDLLSLVYDTFLPDSIALHSITETLDTDTANGRFFLTMLGGIASWERETIGERTRDALRCKQRQGFWLGRVPFGYAITEEGRLTEKLDEYKTLCQAKELRQQGSTIRSIAECLKLSKDTVHRIIKSEHVRQLACLATAKAA